MAIFIIGADGSGKSTAGWLLANELECRAAETGQVVIRELARLYAIRSRVTNNLCAWRHIISAKKPAFRKELVCLGNLMTDLKPTCLVDHCSAERIIVGVRRQCELIGVKNQLNASTENIWIKLERNDFSGGCELNRMPCDYEIKNDGTLAELQIKLRRIAREIACRRSSLNGA